MSEQNSTITYDENWQNVSVPEYPVMLPNEEYNVNNENNDDKSSEKDNKKSYPKQLLITYQLIICLIIALAAFVLKSIGGYAYETVKDWYYSQLNSTVIFDGESGFDFDAVFGAATTDEAENK